VPDYDELRAKVRAFSDARDWHQFHDPKSLILALMGEVGELAELYQWLPAADAADRAGQAPLRRRTAEEIADVLIYLTLLADSLNIDLVAAAIDKLDAAEARYPSQQFSGVAPDKISPPD
jgi:NTP pyrophosphatase (non-canonical NTP hydrolase)